MLTMGSEQEIKLRDNCDLQCAGNACDHSNRYRARVAGSITQVTTVRLKFRKSGFVHLITISYRENGVSPT